MNKSTKINLADILNWIFTALLVAVILYAVLSGKYQNTEIQVIEVCNGIAKNLSQLQMI